MATINCALNNLHLPLMINIVFSDPENVDLASRI